MNETIRIGAVYGRVSVDEAAEIEHGSLEQQRHMGSAVAKQLSDAKGIKHIVQYFLIEERGVSGGTTNRPKYQELLNLITNRKIDFIIAKEISRLNRSTLDFCEFMKVCQANGTSVHIKGLDVDPLAPMGKAMFQMLAVVAELERELIRERTRSSIRSALINNGKLCGGSIPLGFNRDEKRKGFLTPNPQELESVQILMKKFIETMSYRETLKSAEENKIINKNGKAFNKGSLKRLLTNSKYIGKVKIQSEGQTQWINLPHGIVVDETLFMETQEIVKRVYEETRYQNRHQRRIYPLTGLLQFEDETQFRGSSGTGRLGEIHYYYFNQENKITLKAREVEEKVEQSLNSFQSEDKLASTCEIAKRQIESKKESVNKRILDAQRSLSDLEHEKSQLIQHESLGNSDRKTVIDWLHTQLETIHHKEETQRAELAGLQKEAALLGEAPLSPSRLRQVLGELWSQYQATSEVGRRVFFRKFLKGVRALRAGQLHLTWRIPVVTWNVAGFSRGLNGVPKHL